MSAELQQELLIETIEAEPEFEQLLNVAIETTLRDPSIFDLYVRELEQTAQQQDIGSIQRMGLWIANKLLVDQKGKTIRDTQSIAETEMAGDIKEGLRLLLPFEPQIHTKIEAFGKAILHEAFECLGDDAPDKVVEYQTASTVEERIEVCNWLLRRIDAIRETANEEVEEISEDESEEALEQDIVIEEMDEVVGPNFYHPVRISPKLIGKYPNIQVEPTCLGYSILIASFFEKANIPYMHAGVVTTAKDETRIAQRMAIENILLTSEDSSLPISDDLANSLITTALENKRIVSTHNGFHAAVVARLSRDVWIQLDPNYQSNIVLNRSEGRDAELAHGMLTSMNGLASGMELKLQNYISFETIPYVAAQDILIQNIPPTESIDNFLQEVPAESAYSYIIQDYFKDIFDPDGPLEISGMHVSIGNYCRRLGIDQETYTQDTVYTTLLKYVFTDAKNGDLQACIERCKADPSYRRRRAEDLALAPLFTMLRFASHHGNAIINNHIRLPHGILEGGSPTYRIGASALSDFAVYCGDELPLSFWMTYWPSAVSFAEHHINSDSEAQKALKQQISGDIKGDHLLYSIIGDIIAESTSKEDSLDEG